MGSHPTADDSTAMSNSPQSERLEQLAGVHAVSRTGEHGTDEK
jgi:hypothetical protein